MRELTLVTGLFDIGRGVPAGELDASHVRPFARYLEAFEVVLGLDAPMSIYVEPHLETFVRDRRTHAPTRVVRRTLDSIRTGFYFYDRVQEIRRNIAWRNRAGWLAGSPQANLDLYNPLVMSKMGMLHDQSLINPFGTGTFLWLDAGLAFTCRAGLECPRWLDRVGSTLERFLFLCYPYEENGEIHGFDSAAMAAMAETDRIRRVARGGLFGGTAHSVGAANRTYYSLLEASLARGEMGTEENIFTIMSYLAPDQYDRYMLPSNGLIAPFFDSLERGPTPIVSTKLVDIPPRRSGVGVALACSGPETPDLDKLSKALYVLSYNSPSQFALLLQSWSQAPGFLTETSRYLIDNSTDPATEEGYVSLCRQFGFEHIKQDNLGICGGRQFVAQHFDGSTHDYMIFLEDDMMLRGSEAGLCRNGFPTWTQNLFEKLLRIMQKERFDFLKLSFTEVFGNNSEQWAWYNVPDPVRRRIWPELPALPVTGFAEKMPPTRFERIGVLDGLAYATGEVYYANWPHIVGREGNRRMFLDTVWERPYEQTWMSHLFQLSRAGKLRPAVLLASMIEHRREHHYPTDERKES